jgi:hypothetical protein
MPILKGSNDIYIIYKEEKIRCKVLYETETRIALVINENFPNIEKLKYEGRLDFETKQGNYDCFFQSKIEFLGYDYIHNQYIIEIDYPPVFRRILSFIQDK